MILLSGFFCCFFVVGFIVKTYLLLDIHLQKPTHVFFDFVLGYFTGGQILCNIHY